MDEQRAKNRAAFEKLAAIADAFADKSPGWINVNPMFDYAEHILRAADECFTDEPVTEFNQLDALARRFSSNPKLSALKGASVQFMFYGVEPTLLINFEIAHRETGEIGRVKSHMFIPYGATEREIATMVMLKMVGFTAHEALESIWIDGKHATDPHHE